MLSTITGNLIFDLNNGYENLDTEIEAAEGFAHGIYTQLSPIPIDDQPCSGTFTGPFNCPAQLDKPLITIDNVPGSPNNGTIYVYYTLFCIQATPCTDGTATVPPFSSAILVATSRGAGLPFSPPALASGPLTQEQFSYLVVDSHGTPHMFFDDFSGVFPTITMWESTLSGGKWVVHRTPVATSISLIMRLSTGPSEVSARSLQDVGFTRIPLIVRSRRIKLPVALPSPA